MLSIHFRFGSDPASDRSELYFVQEVRRFYPLLRSLPEAEGLPVAKCPFLPGRFLLDRTQPTLILSLNEPETFIRSAFARKHFRVRIDPSGRRRCPENHRCPGETVVLEVMERALRSFLRTGISAPRPGPAHRSFPDAGAARQQDHSRGYPAQ